MKSMDFPENSRRLVEPLVKNACTPSVVVGFADEEGRQYQAFGLVNGTPPDEDTVYEIGSITKLFTAILTAMLVAQGRMRLDDPLESYLPCKVPGKDGKKILLRHVIAHTSGLPRDMQGHSAKDPAQPYTGFDQDLLYRLLPSAKLLAEPGAKRLYSNLGYLCLGHALTLVSGESYQSLLDSRICRPLGMKDTYVPDGHIERLVAGHDEEGRPVPSWHWAETIAHGVGAARSTAKDMLSFGEAVFKGTLPELTAALKLLELEKPNHGGMTAGFNTYFEASIPRRYGLILLANASTMAATIQAERLVSVLTGAAQAADVPAMATGVTLSPAELKEFEGHYNIPLQILNAMGVGRIGTIGIKVKEGRLWIQRFGGLYLIPESKLGFFDRKLFGRYRFQRDDRGRIAGFELDAEVLGIKGFVEKITVVKMVALVLSWLTGEFLHKTGLKKY